MIRNHFKDREGWTFISEGADHHKGSRVHIPLRRRIVDQPLVGDITEGWIRATFQEVKRTVLTTTTQGPLGEVIKIVENRYYEEV